MATTSRPYLVRSIATGKVVAVVDDATTQAHAARVMTRRAWSIEPASGADVLAAMRANVEIISAAEAGTAADATEPSIEPKAA